MESIISRSLEQLNYTHFRPNQKEVIHGYLEGHDVLFCSPTGSGKSLIFEVAPLVFKNLGSEKSCVVVVSPLVALMRHQVAVFQQKGIQAFYIEEMDDCAKNEVENGNADIIFASPESLLGAHRSLMTRLSTLDALKAIFVDEAHCIKKL